MDAVKIMDLANQINKLSYEEKQDIYQRVFSLGSLTSDEMNDRLILISLVALVYQKMKLQDKNVTPITVLLKITGEKDKNSSYYQFLETLAIIAQDFSYDVKKIDTCGFKTSQEIINKIKDLLNTWIPF